MIRRLIERLYEKEAKETFWSFATKIAAAVLFVILNVYLARVLGVERWGSWSFLLSMLTIVFLISYLGVNHSVRAYAARYAGQPELSAVLRDSLMLRVAASAAFTTAFLLLHQQIASALGRAELAPILPYAAPLIFLMGLSEYLKQVFTGIHRLKFHLFVNLIEFGGKIVFAVALLSAAVSLENVLIAHWLALTLSVAVGFIFWRRFYLQPSGSLSGRFTREILRYSMPLFVISIGFVVLTEIDTLMLGLLSTDYEVGQFAVGKQLANKLPQFALALSMGTMPGYARLTPENLPTMRAKFRGILRLNGLFFIPGGVLLIFVAPWLVPLFFGAEYGPAVLPLQILTVWVVMTSFNMFTNALLDYQGRATQRAINFLITITATIGLNLLLIPRYGAVGAAISTTTAYLPYMVLNWLEARRVLQTP